MDSLPMQHSSARMPRELTSDEIDQVGGGALPAIIVVVAKFTGGAFAAGFIGKAGADLYDHFFGEDDC